MNVPVEFHLSPALAVTGVIDYSTPEGRKYFDKSIEKLNEELFDCETDDLHLFIDSLKERAREMGWDIPGVGITDVFLDPLDPDSEYINILDNHGELTLEQIWAFEATCINSTLRTAQDAYAMCRCMMNSMSKSAIKRLGMWKDEYTVNGQASANFLLKVVVRESGLDTKTTATYIRTCLNNLTAHVGSVGDDVLKFNAYAKGLVRSLQERGESSNDLFINLTQGYLACTDKTFKRCISSLIERHERQSTSQTSTTNHLDAQFVC